MWERPSWVRSCVTLYSTHCTTSMYRSHTYTLASSLCLRVNKLIPPTNHLRQLSTRATHFKLNTGDSIPALGFGTFQDAEAQEETVCDALKWGFRLIDTARVYSVKEEVGRGIKKSGVPREDIFVGTKLWCNQFHPADVEKALEESLAGLYMPYIGLLMMHYPCTFKRGSERFPRDADGTMILVETTYLDTWKTMENLRQSGKTKAIAVSKFFQERDRDIDSIVRHGKSRSKTLASFRNADHHNLRFPQCIRWRFIHICNRKTSVVGCDRKAFTLYSSVHWETWTPSIARLVGARA